MNRLPVVLMFCILATCSFAKTPVTDGETDPVMLDLDLYLIEALRGNAMEGRWANEGNIVQLMGEPEFRDLVQKHDLKLFNGPMVGCITPTSAKIWVRTAGAASFQLAVGNERAPVITTTAKNDFTGIAEIEGLKPFTEYSYSILMDGREITQDYFRFRTAPEAGQGARFSIAFGSGARYMPKNEGIWRVLSQTRPIAYLGLGDNVYIDVTEKQNVQRLHYYRRMLRQEYREMIAGSAIYAIWDDHDMGNNDSEGGYGLEAPWKLPNLQVFRENWNNPFYGLPPEAPGTYCNFRMGDVEVFMTDGRFYRYGPKSKKRDAGPEKPMTMLGEVQKQWLMNGLKNSTATFKVLASGTMWHAQADKGGGDSWAGPRSPFQHERDEIFDFIDKEKISGVILISGDRHRTDIWKTERPKGYPLYEFLSAKMTNVHGHGARKEALWSYSAGRGLGKDVTGECFWGQLDFDTTQKDPTVTFKAINQSGKELKSFTLAASELKASAQTRGSGWPQGVRSIQYPASIDDSQQPMLVSAARSRETRPLLVGLHTWSGDYLQTSGHPYARWCEESDWHFIHPHFRGPNWTPDACGSEKMVSDIVDAVAYMQQNYAVDSNRIYLVGVSGGGYAALLMAGRAPEIWAGVSAWAPISDLHAWWQQKQTLQDGKVHKRKYAVHIEKSVGGAPDQSEAAAEECVKRSAITYLHRAVEVNLDINAGVTDGHQGGSVPFTHALRAFNATVPENERLADDVIDAFYDGQRLPDAQPKADIDALYDKKQPIFRKIAQNTRVTIFKGAHEILHKPALNWLAHQRKGEGAVWQLENARKWTSSEAESVSGQ